MNCVELGFVETHGVHFMLFKSLKLKKMQCFPHRGGIKGGCFLSLSEPENTGLNKFVIIRSIRGIRVLLKKIEHE